MEIYDFLKSNMILVSFIAICLFILLIRIPYLCKVHTFPFSYRAKTKYRNMDHNYNFFIKKANGGYRCYIESTPSFRGRDTSRYMHHYWVEKGTNRPYICWTGKIKYPEQAKTLCKNWSDATQQFIDTGTPAPGFERL